MKKHITCPYCDTAIRLPTHIDFIKTVRCAACHGLFDYEIETSTSTPRSTRTYYEILGLEPLASVETIKRRFRELMMRFHPDRAPQQSEKASTLTKLLNEAYEVLGTPEDRSRYDAILAKEQPASLDLASSKPTETYPDTRRGWGWFFVLVLLVILFFAHHGIPIGVRAYGSYYTDHISIYNAPVIIRYIYNKRMHHEE